jgi:hypothetical protein
MPSKDNGFSVMTTVHLGDVEQLDCACNGGDFPAKRLRAAIRDSHNRAYVIVEEGDVKAFAVFTQRRNPPLMHIERMGAVSKRHYQMMLDGLYYLSDGLFGHDDCESIYITVPWDNLTLRTVLYENGFSVGKCRGVGKNRKISFSKIMVESTWHEGTYYPRGNDVIHEIMSGDCRSLPMGAAATDS